jgi:hypothetical protein
MLPTEVLESAVHSSSIALQNGAVMENAGTECEDPQQIVSEFLFEAALAA